MDAPLKTRRFHILMSDQMSTDLAALSAAREVPIASMVRTAIVAYIAHTKAQQPTCADGSLCLCPNRWSRTERIRRLDGPAARPEAAQDDPTNPDAYMEGAM